MLALRQHAREVVEQVQRGQILVLTYRGRSVARIVPIRSETADADDPFYGLADLADRRGASLTNRQIDDLVYGA
jgi:prevent-host-death family protein